MAEPVVLVFVHGWSVTSKDTYGELPEAIKAAADDAGIDVQLESIHLSRYISFRDEVTMDDIARGMNHAVKEKNLQRFSCITHSTGGPLVRRWVDKYYAKRLNECPLRHLVMLAPANHGSALAILGKGRLGRIKSWFGGMEPGQGILDWLCLGSTEAWTLQDSFTDYALNKSAFFPFVLSGETIDDSFYDFVNDYLVEKGSDGVVRLAGANLNYTFFQLEQTDERYDDVKGTAYKLRVTPRTKPRPPRTPFGAVPNASHSGTKIGIMRSVARNNVAQKPVVAEIVRCLKVETQDDYAQCLAAFDQLTTDTQQANIAQYGKLRRFVMFIFRIRDDSGRTINDYDLLLLGDDFEPDQLPKGFFVDRQKNQMSGALVYYLDYDVLATTEHLGFRVNARPLYGEPGAPTPDGFAGYFRAEFRLEKKDFQKWVHPNETVYVDIKLSRHVDSEAIRFDGLDDRGSFKKIKPRGHLPRD